MAEFNLVLRKCMEETGISQIKLAEKIGCSRAMIYSVLNKDKRLSESSFRKLIEEEIFSTEQKQDLRLAYYKSVYSEITVDQMKCIYNYLTGAVFQQAELFSIETGQLPEKTTAISGEKQIIKTVIGMLSRETAEKEKPFAVCNYPSTEKKLNYNIYTFLKNCRTEIDFRKIIDFDGCRTVENDIAAIFENLRFLTLGYSLYSNHKEAEKETDNDVSFRSYICVSDCLLFFDMKDKTGIFITDKEFAAAYRDRVDKKIHMVQRLSEHYDNIFALKDSLISVTGKFPLMAFDSFPRTCIFYNEEDFDKIIRKDIPDREILIKMAAAYFSDVAIPEKFRYVVSAKGLQSFAKTGIINELPLEYIEPLPAEDRKRVLQKYLENIEKDNSRVFLCPVNNFPFDEKYFGYEIHEDRMYMYSSTENMAETKFAGSSSFVFYDKKLISVFESYADYFVRNRLFFNRDTAIRFLKDLILQCDMYK